LNPFEKEAQVRNGPGTLNQLGRLRRRGKGRMLGGTSGDAKKKPSIKKKSYFQKKERKKREMPPEEKARGGGPRRKKPLGERSIRGTVGTKTHKCF